MTARPAPPPEQRQPAPPRQRQRQRGRAGEEAALTEVVSTFLMLGIAVGFAAGFSLLLLALPGPQPEPHLTLGTFILPTATDTLVLEHRGGRDLPLRSMVVSLNIGGAQVQANLGERLDAADPAWQVVDANGVARTSAQNFQPGDQVRFTDAAIRGVATSLSVLDTGRGSLAMASAVVNQADTARPQVSSARTTSTTTLQVNFTEALASVAASDFTVAGHTISSAVLLGDGTAVELTVNAMTTSETPLVSVIASPTGTRDLANNLVLGGGSATPADGIAPSVSAVVTATGNTTAFVNWTSSEAATGWLDYGPDQLYGLGAATASGTTHSASLTGLTPTTVYHFKIRAIDAAGNNLTTEPDRTFTTTDLNGTGGGGGGGGGTTTIIGDPPPNFLEFTTIPSLPLSPGVASGAFTLTLKNTTGAAIAPPAGSPLTITLATNSTRGYFLDSAGTSVVTSVTMTNPATTAQFRYVDLRVGATSGPSVVTAAALNTTPAAVVVTVTDRGLAPSAGDSLGSVLVHLIIWSEQEEDNAGVHLGLNILNPTPTARTIDQVSLTASPALATAFFRTLSTGAGSDAEFSCAWGGANTNTATCNPTDFTLPAWGMKQVVLVFQTASTTTNGHTVVGATVTFAGGAGTATSAGVNVRHNSVGFQVRILGETGAGGNEVAGFQGVTGGVARDFYFEWDLIADTGTCWTRFYIPAGWSSVSVPTQAELTNVVADVRQPTLLEEGYVDTGALCADREMHIRATPPAITGLALLRVELVQDGGTAQPIVTSKHAFGVAIV